jgi:hypothetical protein
MEAELRVKALTLEDLAKLDVTVDLATAGRAFGMGRTKANNLAKAEQFPCQVLQLGCRRVVTKVALLAALGYAPDLTPLAEPKNPAA